MMLAQIRIDAPKNGARSREAHISVDIVVAPAMNTSGGSTRRFTRPSVAPSPWRKGGERGMGAMRFVQYVQGGGGGSDRPGRQTTHDAYRGHRHRIEHCAAP